MRTRPSALLAPLAALAIAGLPGVSLAAEVRTLTLDEALRLLDAQSPALAQARGRVDEARAVVGLATAPLLPTLGVSGAYTRNNAAAEISIAEILVPIEQGLSQATGRPVTFDRSRLPGATVIQPLESFSAAAALRVPLFSAHAWKDRAAALSAADATEASVEAIRRGLRSALVEAAWWSAAVEEVVEASQKAVHAAGEHRASALRRVEAGLAPPLAGLQAETDLVQRESDLVDAAAARDRAWLALGVLLGAPEPVRVALPEDPLALAGDPETLVAEALAARPELRARAAAVEAARAQVESAWWRLAPGLSANLSGVASSVAFPTGDQTGWRATLDLQWALYDGGFRSARRRQAEAALAIAEAGLQAERLQITREVLDALREVEVSRERLRLAVRQRELAAEASSSASRSFEAGLTGSLDALDANLRIWQASVGLARTKARVGVAFTGLERAIGRAR